MPIPKWHVNKRKDGFKNEMKSICIVVEVLFHINFDGMLLRCVDAMKAWELMK
jgi:hypothetical protein